MDRINKKVDQDIYKIARDLQKADLSKKEQIKEEGKTLNATDRAERIKKGVAKARAARATVEWDSSEAKKSDRAANYTFSDEGGAISRDKTLTEVVHGSNSADPVEVKYQREIDGLRGKYQSLSLANFSKDEISVLEKLKTDYLGRISELETKISIETDIG